MVIQLGLTTEQEEKTMAAYNVTSRLNGNKLVIEVDLSERTIDDAPLSSTGRSKLVATTGGFMDSGVDGVAFSVNVSAKLGRSRRLRAVDNG
jgi:hypothetical protein